MILVQIVDDDAGVLESLGDALSREGYAPRSARSPEEFLRQMETAEPAVAILDVFYSHGGMDGEALLGLVQSRWPDTQCIMVSGESDIRKALACVRAGALDFLEKPVSLTRLLIAVANAAKLHEARKSARSRIHILGRSQAMRDVMKRIRKLAVLGESVLIRGESGTGKELVAENLHAFSQRQAKGMRKVNCAALSPGLVESELFGHKAGSFTGAQRDKAGLFAAAQDGTLFIDEIGDFEHGLQAKFLRVLQEKTILPVGATEELAVNVRTLFATHVDLEAAMEKGGFRRDLYFRISTFTLVLPPLRDRLEDIDDLAVFFADKFLAENGLPPKSISKEALDKLKGHAYPGNIRELAQIVKNAVYFCEKDVLAADDIELRAVASPDGFWDNLENRPLDQAKAAFERELLRRRLRQAHGNVAKTAEGLGLIKNNLYRKLREHGLAWGEDASAE